MTPLSLDYDAANHILTELAATESAANAHGLLCGQCCSYTELALNDWISMVLTPSQINHPYHSALEALYQETLQQLNDTQFQFELLIANDQKPLTEQLASLIAWCQGFLTGLGLGKIDTDDDVLEAIQDIAQIAKLSAHISDSEENMQDYYQLSEFVRIAVLLIYDTQNKSQ